MRALQIWGDEIKDRKKGKKKFVRTEILISVSWEKQLGWKFNGTAKLEIAAAAAAAAVGKWGPQEKKEKMK